MPVKGKQAQSFPEKHKSNLAEAGLLGIEFQNRRDCFKFTARNPSTRSNCIGGIVPRFRSHCSGSRKRVQNLDKSLYLIVFQLLHGRFKGRTASG